MNDLGARLHDLADSMGDWDDPLPEVLRRVSAPAPDRHVGADRHAVRPFPSVIKSTTWLPGRPPLSVDHPLDGRDGLDGRGRWTSVLSIAAAVCATLLVVGGVVAILRSGAGSTTSSSAASGMAGLAALPSCGTAPVTSGPLASSVRLRVDAPRTARSGDTLTARLTVRVVANGPTVLSGWPTLTVLHAGSIVASSAVAATGISRPLEIGSSTESASVVLRRCSPSDDGPILPPGDYQLVASLPYSLDAAQGPQQWVSAPVTVTVTVR